MSKRSFITNITPLPASISRETAITLLHDHHQMIKLNPLVIRHEPTAPHPKCTPDEVEHMTWYVLTDQIQYLPGVKGEVVYKAGFYNLPRGLQTHAFAAAGVELQGKWTVGGNAPGEERETVEIGVQKPRDGLYLREDVDVKCSVFLTGFVKKNLKKSHGVLVKKLLQNADALEESRSRSPRPGSMPSPNGVSPPDASHQTLYATRNPASPTPSSQLSIGAWRAQHGHAVKRPVGYGQVQQQVSDATLPTQSWQQTAAANSPQACYCTGGVHLEGCPQYPGLRLASQRPEEQTRHTDTLGASETAHRATGSSRYFGLPTSGRQAELPLGEDPANIARERTWPNLQVRSDSNAPQSHGMDVTAELEGDPVMAQRYYEYTAQKAAELE